MEAYLLKLNGWPSLYDERIVHLSSAVDSLVVIRSKPSTQNASVETTESTTIYDIPPKRGSFVGSEWLKPLIFSLHVGLAIVISLGVMVKRGHRPGVIHAMDYILGGFAALVVSRVARVPFAVSVRGLKRPIYQNILEQEGTVFSLIRYWILVFLSNQILPRADLIVTKAVYQQNYLNNKFDLNADVITVPTGVDFDTFDSQQSYEHRLGELFPDAEIADDTVVLFLSNQVPRKGVDRLLELVIERQTDLPEEVRFALVGEFRSESFESRVRELCEKAGDQVLLHPEHVPFESVPGYLADAGAVTLLSEPGNEGVPRILQEATAVGTPIIASDVTGISQAFEPIEGCVLIDRSDPCSFSDAVRKVAVEEVTVDMSEVRRRFDIRSNYAKYGEAYERLRSPTE